MKTIADIDVFTVTTVPGAVKILRKADGKTATFTGRGLAAMFRKHLIEHDGDVERVVSAWVRSEGRPVVWQ